MKINDVLVEFVTPQAVAQDPGLEREKDVDVIFFGRPGKDYNAEDAWAALEEVLPAEYPPGSEKAQYKVAEVAKSGGAVVTTKPLSVAKQLVSTFTGYGIKSRVNGNLTEFAPDSNDGGEDDVLRNYARMWWAGDEATQMQIERALAKMGWEIGEDEGGYDNGGVFVVRAGDENGNSYQSWPAEDLTEGLTEVDRRGFLKGLGAAAVAGAAGGATTKANAQEITKWVNYATNLATKTMGGRIHQDTGYDLRNWLVVNVSNWVTDYCNKTNSFNAQTVIDYCNQQGVEAAGLDKQNALVTAFLTNMKNRYQDFLSAYRAGINEAIQTYYRINQSKQQEKNAMGNLGKEEFDVLIDALIVYAICKDRQLDNSDLFKAVAASIKRFIDANNAKDYVNSIYPKAKQSVEVLKNNPELYQKESAQFFKNAGSTIEKLDRLSSNKKPEFESVEPGVAEGNRKPEPPEADYGDDYQDMVSRVKKLAGLGPLRTVYDPQKRVYKNVPTAVQPKKEQR